MDIYAYPPLRRCVSLPYPPMTEGYIFLPRAVRPEVKKYNPRSEVDHLRIYTDKEVVLLYNFDFIPPSILFEIHSFPPVRRWFSSISNEQSYN